MTTFTLPTSRRVTQDWGQDFQWLNGKHYPNGFYASIGWKGHNGIDYGCPEGDPVESVCDGVVEYVGAGNNHPLLSGGGSVVLIRNDEMQMRFEYLHLSQQNVYTGQKVRRGQVIARSGNTGTSTAPHLHLGAIPVKPNLNNGYRGRVDPTGWLYGPSNPDYSGIGPQGTTTQAEEADVLAESDRQMFKDFLDDYFISVRRFEGNRNIFDAVNQTRTDVLSVKAAAESAGATAAGVPETILYGERQDGRNLFDWLKQIRGDVLGIQPGSIDVTALAASIAERLPKADVEALAAQLTITVKAGK